MARAAAAAAEADENLHGRPLEDSDAAPTPTDAANKSDADADGPASKKRKIAAGARGVANLTPEQLAKKRANDREAQRAIRERTKNQIQTLERRIEELTSLQPYQELQAVVEAKEAAERENVEMRQRLATIVSMLQPLVGQLPDGLATATEPRSKTAAAADAERHGTHSPAAGPQPTTSQTQPVASNGHHVAQRLNDLDQQREQLRHGLDMGPERLGLGFLLDANHQVSRIQGAVHGALDTPHYQNQQHQHPQHSHHHHHSSLGGNSSGAYSASPGPNHTVGTWPPPPAPMPPPSSSSSSATYHTAFPSGYPYQGPHGAGAAHHDDASNGDELIEVPSSSSSNTQHPSSSTVTTTATTTTPRYAAPVRTMPPTCPLDSLLLDFLSERRQRTAEGLPVHEVIGPRYPSVSSLLNPAHSVYSHPLSRVFTDILAKFPDISGLAERVAVLYIMFLVMRWQVSPTRENYERLPSWVRPLRLQLLTPHPPWVDYLPFPRMREILVKAQRDSVAASEYLFDDFFIPYTTTLTLSWPYHDTDTLLQSPHSEELMINPVFERHLRNLDNWKLGEAFARAFPGLADTCNVPPGELAAAKRATQQAQAGMRPGYGQSPM